MGKEKNSSFEGIFRDAPLPMWVCSRKSLKILAANREANRVSGYAENGLSGLTMDNLCCPAGSDLPSLLKRAANSAEPVESLCHLNTRSGEVRLSHIRVRALRFQSENSFLIVANHIFQPDKPGPLGPDSEERWRTLVQHSRDFICTVDRQGRILYLNRTLPGLDVKNVYDHSIFDFIPEDQHKIPRKALETVFQNGEPAEYEIRAAGPHGRLSWYATRIGPVFENSKVILANMVSVDITDQKNAMEEIRYVQSYLRTLYKVSPDMIFLFDRECELIDLNENSESATGYTREELAGNGYEKLTGGDPEFRERLKEALTGVEIDFERKISRKDGTFFICELRLRRVRFVSAEGDAQPHVLAIGRDVSSRKKHAKETQRRMRQLVALRRAVEMLTGTVELEPLLETILKAARIAIPAAEKGAILLYDESTGKIEIRAMSGYRDGRARSIHLSPRSGYVSQVIANRKACLIRDARADAKIRYDGNVEEIRAIQSAVAAPLIVKERMIGVISLDNCQKKDAFSPEDLKLLVSFAAPAAAALENARLYAALRESEARYRSLVEHAPEGICVFDAETGYFVDANTNICKMFGYSRKEFLARSPQKISAKLKDKGPFRQEDFEKQMIKVLEGEVSEFEWRFMRANGRVFPAEVRLVRLPSQKGRLVRGTLTDISERKEAEEAIRRYTRQLRIYQNIDRAILAAESIEEIATSAIDEIRKLIPSERVSVLIFDWEKREAELIAVNTSLPTRLKKGSRVPFRQFHNFDQLKNHKVVRLNNLSALPKLSPVQKTIYDEGIRGYFHISLVSHGQFIGLLNISSTRENTFNNAHAEIAIEIANQLSIAIYQELLKTKIRKYSEELERKVLERTEDLESFTYSVSHDLRAPLRAMHGFAQALAEDYGEQFDDEGRAYIRQILTAAKRMDQLIRGLLEYSRLGRQEIEPRPVDTDAVFTAVLKNLRDEINQKQVRLHVEEPLPRVMGQPAVLEQVLANLLENAIKFTYPHRPPEIRIRAEKSGEMVRIWVEDNGVGIAGKYLECIFNVFERLYPVEMYAGTGIGLAIVEKSVRQMGGRVGVESDPDKGSRFWFELPAVETNTKTKG